MQKEATANMTEAGQRLQSPRTLMAKDQLETMGKELVRLCDLMEKHGLVDYQMGVWEEDIIQRRSWFLIFVSYRANFIAVVGECLDLLEENEAARASSTRQRR